MGDKVAIQHFVEERIGKPVRKKPLLPEIINEEAITAQNELNKMLKRYDISSNALPSQEEKILTVLVHGYMSSKWLWIDPYFGTFGWLRDYRNEPKPRSYGWHLSPPPSHMYVPFDVSVSPIVYPEGIFNRLMRVGYEVLTYSQLDAAGDIDISAKELEIILDGIKKVYGKKRIVLVGHSRGGICIRRYLDLNNNNLEVEKIITLSSPHHGSNHTNMKIIKQPAIKILNDASVKKIWDASGKREVRDLSYEQMSPDSSYLKDLSDFERHPEIEYITAGGTCARYANIYTWAIGRKISRKTSMKKIFNFRTRETKREEKQRKSHRGNKQYQWIAYPKKILTIFDKGFIPEITFGDGLVSFPNTILNNAKRKYKIDANHEEMAVCNDIKKLILKELKLLKRKG